MSIIMRNSCAHAKIIKICILGHFIKFNKIPLIINLFNVVLLPHTTCEELQIVDFYFLIIFTLLVNFIAFSYCTFHKWDIVFFCEHNVMISN